MDSIQPDVANGAVVSHEMSTTNRGRMVSMDRGPLIGKHPYGPVGREQLNASEQPADFTEGPNGDVGEMDSSNHCGWDT